MSAYAQKLIIFCPAHFATKYAEISNLFTAEGHLQLLIDKNNYARIKDGESSKFANYFNGVGIKLNLRRVGFNIKVNDGRFALQLALEELAALSLSTTYGNYTPIVIHDYCRVEWQDYDRGFTKRVGKVEDIEDGDGGGGTVMPGYRTGTFPSAEIPDMPNRGVRSGGFRFRFLEKDLRLVS